MTVKLRYKEPDGDTSKLVSCTVPDRARRADAEALGFAAAVAEFGMLLRKSEFRAAPPGRARRSWRGSTAARIPTATAPSSCAWSSWPPRSIRRPPAPIGSAEHPRMDGWSGASRLWIVLLCAMLLLWRPLDFVFELLQSLPSMGMRGAPGASS